MSKRFQLSAEIPAASQFLGSEFALRFGKPNKAYKVLEIHLIMGAEAKTYSILKTMRFAAGLFSSVLRTDTASNTTSVVLSGADAGFVLLPGEQIQFTTAGATSAMFARVVYEEVDNSPEPAFNDPKFTR